MCGSSRKPAAALWRFSVDDPQVPDDCQCSWLREAMRLAAVAARGVPKPNMHMNELISYLEQTLKRTLPCPSYPIGETDGPPEEMKRAIAIMLWHRLLGRQRPSLADYVAVPGPRGRATAAAGLFVLAFAPRLPDRARPPARDRHPDRGTGPST